MSDDRDAVIQREDLSRVSEEVSSIREAEPLSLRERMDWIRGEDPGERSRCTAFMTRREVGDLCDRYEATLQAAEERVEELGENRDYYRAAFEEEQEVCGERGARVRELQSRLLFERQRRQEAERVQQHAVEQQVELDTKLRRSREAKCGACGRSLPPDGDCYGCEADRLRAEHDRYHAALVARHGGEPVALLSELDACREELREARGLLRDALTRLSNYHPELPRAIRTFLDDAGSNDDAE